MVVDLMKNNVKLSPESHLHRGDNLAPVKLELEDSLEDQHAPLNKRSKLSSSITVSSPPLLLLFYLIDDSG